MKHNDHTICEGDNSGNCIACYNDKIKNNIRLQTIKEIEGKLPEADTSVDADQYERADRIAWNAYRTKPLQILNEMKR